MKFVDNWKDVAWRSWSLWMNRIGLAILILPELAYAAMGYDLFSPYARFWVGVSLMLAAEVARYIDQGLRRE